MPHVKKGYNAMLQNVISTLKHSPEEMSHVLTKSEEVVAAANDMTKDEIALISAYLKADLKEFSSNYEESKSGPFYLTLTNTMWQGLLEITDRTKVEWVELFQDLEHQGVYTAGEIIGLGTLICEKCNHKTEYTHAESIVPCIRCGHEQFTRQALEP
jgi:hypothetical protein